MSGEQATAVRKIIIVEYAFPLLRAIYCGYYSDEGQSDEEVRADVAREKPSARIRKITREVEAA